MCFFCVCCCHIDLIAVVLEGGILLYLLKAEFLVKKFLEWPFLKFWLAYFNQVNLKRLKKAIVLSTRKLCAQSAHFVTRDYGKVDSGSNQ